MAHQIGTVTVIAGQRATDARPDVHRQLVELDRMLDRVLNLDRRRSQSLGIGRTGDDDRELVSAEACDQVESTDRLQPGSEAFDQAIPRVMAERVVQLLEAIEVDHQQARQALAVPARERCDTFVEATPVRQSCQIVRERRAAAVEEREVFAKGHRCAKDHQQQRGHREYHPLHGDPHGALERQQRRRDEREDERDRQGIDLVRKSPRDDRTLPLAGGGCNQ
ncbi:MAG TPA: hypothetical protein VN817_01300, partial [Solirubrobacteraceae bacterium]|nr:hypothetical protein [Solirubrobacteraceae bacterium]